MIESGRSCQEEGRREAENRGKEDGVAGLDEIGTL